MTEEKRKKVYSVNDVAKMCHVSNETIRRWVRKNGLKAYNTSSGLAIKIVASDLEAFAKELNVFVDWDAV
jgi:excisionase family DNA binding protein